MRQVFKIELPITEEQADVAGIPREWFERAVRRLGQLTEIRDISIPNATLAAEWKYGSIRSSE